MKAGWNSKPLGELLQRMETVNPLQSPNEEFCYIDVSSVSNKTFQIEETQKLFGKDAPSRARRLVNANDVIFATIRPTLQRIAIVPDELDGQVCSTGYFVMKPKREIDHRFLFYNLFTENFMNQMEAYQKGASYPAVTDAEVRAQVISFPPLPEQQRIVTILDEAFDGIATAKANAEKNLQNARALFDSHLQRVFSERGEGWVDKPLEKAATIINGFAFKSTDFSPKGVVKSIKITNVGVREFVCDSDCYLPEGFDTKYGAVSVQKGSIVIALTRTIISGGLKVAVVPDVYHGALINQRVAAISACADILAAPFLFAYLSTQEVVDYVKERVNTLMQPNLSINDLRAMPIPLPTVQEQNVISTQLDELREETQRLESIYQQKLSALEALKKSLLDQAFTGEL